MQRASAPQHAALQMALADIALQKDWPPRSGKLHGPGVWWQLLVAAYDREKKQERAQFLPAVDGVGFDGGGVDIVRGERRRRNLNSMEIGDILEYVNAWAASNGVQRRKPERRAA